MYMPYTSFTYDALNRPLVTTDGGGGTVTNTYPGRDMLSVVASPSSSKQYEYNGLGQLISVCEISSSLPGVGPCRQDREDRLLDPLSVRCARKFDRRVPEKRDGVVQRRLRRYSVSRAADAKIYL